MRNMKDSGIEWIGGIPEDWNISKTKYLVDSIESGGTPDSSNNKYYTENEDGISWVTINDMSNKKYIYSTKKMLTKEGLDSKNLNIYPINTILYSIYASVGKVSELKVPASISQAILALMINGKINKKWFVYNLKAMEEYIFSLASSNTQFNLNAKKVNNFYFVLPELEEQELIADYLDNKVKRIDNIISKTKETIEEYKKYKQSVITEAVTKGLNANVEMKDSGIEWIGETPKHWNVIALKHKVDLNLNCLDENTSDEYEFDYIEIGSVTFENGIENKERVKFENAPSRARRVVKKNDIIISTVRTYLKAIATIEDDKDTIVSTGFAVLTPRDINHCFLSYYVKSNCFAELVSAHSYGVSYPAINSSKIISFKVVVPPMEEQLIIGNYLDKKCTEIGKLISKKEELITELEQYKKSLIYECVTGKKEVSPAYAY